MHFSIGFEGNMEFHKGELAGSVTDFLEHLLAFSKLRKHELCQPESAGERFFDRTVYTT